MYLRPISSIRVNPVDIQAPNKTGSSQVSQTIFRDTLASATEEIRSLDKKALETSTDLLLGNARDLHTATLAAEKASLALDLVISVRNKAIEAYQEIMRMPV